MEIRVRQTALRRWRLLRFAMAMAVIGGGLNWVDQTARATGRPGLHPVSIIDADVFVNRFKTTVRLRFFAEDLAMIQGMEPDAGEIYSKALIEEYFADHQKYLLENIQLRDIDGKLIAGRILESNDSAVPDAGVNAGQLMNVSLGMVIEYAYESPPEFLTMVQDVADPDFLFPSEVKVIIKQSGVDRVQATILKPQMPETFRFDWSQAASGESDEQMSDDWFDRQRENVDLGIESYSSVYSFLYINRQEVRHEILVPLASLAAAADIKFNNRDRNFLDIDEQDAIKPEIEKYFVEGNPVAIDGIVVKPVVERIDFYGLDVRDFVIQAARKRVSMANGRVGIMLRYSTKGPPQEVRLTWDRFSKSMTNVDSVIFPYDQAEKAKFARYLPENTFVWHSPGTPPLPKLTEVESAAQGWLISEPGAILAALGFGSLLVGIIAAFWPGFLIRPPAAVAIGAVFLVLGSWGIYQQWPRYLHLGPQIDESTATAVFQQLHKNIFRAFDYQNEENVYDALAASVDGPFLRETYKKINERLKMQDQGGAVSRIDEVRFLDGSLEPDSRNSPDPGFNYRCRWNLVGSIEHWGHIHQRSIVYEAVFRVQPRHHAWKITAMDITDEEPPKIRTSVRKLNANANAESGVSDTGSQPGISDPKKPEKPETATPSGSDF